MDPLEAFEFFKYGRVNKALAGALLGGAAGTVMQARRLHGEGTSARQDKLRRDIEKHRIELGHNPSKYNKFKLKLLQKQLGIASTAKKHPKKALLLSGLASGGVGALLGKKLPG